MKANEIRDDILEFVKKLNAKQFHKSRSADEYEHLISLSTCCAVYEIAAQLAELNEHLAQVDEAVFGTDKPKKWSGNIP